MPLAVFILVAFAVLGDVAQRLAQAPVPGPVIGMVLLTIVLLLRRTVGAPHPAALAATAAALIRHMGLLFVPAGAGLLAEATVIRQEWLAILVGVVGSTLVSLVVTGLVMDRVGRLHAASVGRTDRARFVA